MIKPSRDIKQQWIKIPNIFNIFIGVTFFFESLINISELILTNKSKIAEGEFDSYEKKIFKCIH